MNCFSPRTPLLCEAPGILTHLLLYLPTFKSKRGTKGIRRLQIHQRRFQIRFCFFYPKGNAVLRTYAPRNAGRQPPATSASREYSNYNNSSFLHSYLVKKKNCKGRYCEKKQTHTQYICTNKMRQPNPALLRTTNFQACQRFNIHESSLLFQPRFNALLVSAVPTPTTSTCSASGGANPGVGGLDGSQHHQRSQDSSFREVLGKRNIRGKCREAGD